MIWFKRLYLRNFPLFQLQRYGGFIDLPGWLFSSLLSHTLESYCAGIFKYINVVKVPSRQEPTYSLLPIFCQCNPGLMYNHAPPCKPVSEFNEFKPRLKSAKNRLQLSAGLNLEKN